MTIKFSNALKNARSQAIVDLLDAATSEDGGAKIQIWTGECPTHLPTSPASESYTLLGEILLATTASSTSNSVFSLNATIQGTAIATGVAGWARLIADNPAGASAKILMDVSIGTSGHPIIMANTSIVIGTPLNIASFYITEN